MHDTTVSLSQGKTLSPPPVSGGWGPFAAAATAASRFSSTALVVRGSSASHRFPSETLSSAAGVGEGEGTVQGRGGQGRDRQADRQLVGLPALYGEGEKKNYGK